jgi:hypothetical protein
MTKKTYLVKVWQDMLGGASPNQRSIPDALKIQPEIGQKTCARQPRWPSTFHGHHDKIEDVAPDLYPA